MPRRLRSLAPLVLVLTACASAGPLRSAPPLPASAATASSIPSSSQDREVERRADELLARARALEPALSRLLQDVATRVHGHLVAFDHRLKTRDSLIRKIGTHLKKRPGDRAAAVAIGDVLRYTLEVEDQPVGNHAAAIRATLSELEAAGHQVELVKNYWPRGDNYSGVNAVLIAPNGLEWELQFHTPESFRMKMREHALYEEMRLDSTAVERKRVLDRQLGSPWEHSRGSPRYLDHPEMPSRLARPG